MLSGFNFLLLLSFTTVFCVRSFSFYDAFKSRIGKVAQGYCINGLYDLNKKRRGMKATKEVIEHNETIIKPCYYQVKEGYWRHRLLLNELKPGQLLHGKKLDQDLLNGKTGPKVFFECGVGMVDSKGDWKIVNGMLRLGTPFKPKPSVIKKRVTRLKAAEQVELYVANIRLAEHLLEVALTEEKALEISETPRRTPLSKLHPNHELIGTVKEVRDYGVIVDVYARRVGLLRIQKVADLFGMYINKKEGLEDAGLERGAKIRVVVESINDQRLSLDFPDSVKEDLKEEREKNIMKTKKKKGLADETNDTSNDGIVMAQEGSVDNYMSATELAEWAAFADEGSLSDMEGENNFKNEFDASEWEEFITKDNAEDEDRSIEDSLGLGSY